MPNYYCLKAPFHPQKAHPKTILAHIFCNIIHKNKDLPGSDPDYYETSFGHQCLCRVQIGSF